MQDEMIAGLLDDPVVTPNTIEEVIEHVSSPCSPSHKPAGYQCITEYFVLHSDSYNNSCSSLFIQVEYIFNLLLLNNFY